MRTEYLVAAMVLIAIVPAIVYGLDRGELMALTAVINVGIIATVLYVAISGDDESASHGQAA